MLCYESHLFKNCEVQEKLCDPGHQVCPTQTCSRKKQVKNLFVSDLPCAPSCAGCKRVKGRKDSSWNSILAGVCHLCKKVAVAEGESQQWVVFRRVANLARSKPHPWGSGPCSERRVWFPCPSSRHPLPLVLFYLLPAFRENPGGEIFRWVRQGSLFL